MSSDKEYKTSNGKTIKIYRVKNTALYCINFSEGGSLPAELSGFYTSPSLADKAVKNYLANHKPDKRYTKKEAVQNGETEA